MIVNTLCALDVLQNMPLMGDDCNRITCTRILCDLKKKHVLE